MEKLRRRQKFFLETIKTYVTLDILEIDTAANNNEPTLRQMLMSITSQKNKEVPLFHCIDLDYRRQGFAVQYSEQNAMEAECVLNTIIPYIDYLYPDSDYVKEAWFDDNAIDRCARLVYDPIRNMVVDKDGTAINNIDYSSDDELAGFEFTHDDDDDREDKTDSMRPEQIIPNYRRNVGPYDTDSVTTFGTRPTKTPAASPKKDGDMVSALSNGGASTASQREFRFEMKNTVTELREENRELREEIKNMMALLKGNVLAGSAAARDGVPNADLSETARGSKTASGQDL